MSAPEGNKNAEKWTFEKSEQLINDMLKRVDVTEIFKVNGIGVEGYKFDFIGEICREFDVYHQLVTRDIYKRHTELQDKINILVSRLEANCYSNTKKGIINTAVGIINLKSNHKWKDRIDATTEDKQITTPVIINWNGDKANTETSGGSQDS